MQFYIKRQQEKHWADEDYDFLMHEQKQQEEIGQQYNAKSLTIADWM